MTNHGYGLEEEAIRLVKMLVFVVPQKVRNLRIVYNKTTHIHFRLPKPKPQVKPPVEAVSGEQQTIEYTIVPEKKETTETPTTPKKSYHYTINLPK